MEETESFQKHVRAFIYSSELNVFFVRGGRLGQDFPNQQYAYNSILIFRHGLLSARTELHVVKAFRRARQAQNVDCPFDTDTKNTALLLLATIRVV